MKYKIGDVIKVTITSIVQYGVFVKVDDEYTGLIHISEVTDKYIKNIEEYFKSETILKVKVIGIDEEKKHLKLSMKDPNLRKNDLIEVGLGFNELKNKLPEWINEAKKELQNNK